MKKQKHLFQKYHKKYSFFQKSFFDFLYWRSTKNVHSSSISRNQENSFQRFYPLEQEKMSFYDYWKTSEHKTFQQTLKSSKGVHRLAKQSPGASPDALPSAEGFGLVERKNSQIDFSSLSSANSLKVYRRKTEKFHFLFSKKRKGTFSKRYSKNLRKESFLPKNSSFEISENFSFLNFKPIGNFFPKKKNFMQYWIFPFLGILFFFSQNAFVLLLQKEQKYTHFLSKPTEKQERSRFPVSFGEKTQFDLQPSFKGQHGNEFLKFSFPQRKFTKMHFYNNLEKTEYEEFLKFYSRIFQQTNFFSLPVFETQVFHPQNKSLDKISFTETFVFQQNSQKKLELKRNTFHWKWFSLSGVETISRPTTIPQKAEFFSYVDPQHSRKNPFLSTVFSSFKRNSKKLSTPLFDYSNSQFLIDEFKRDFTFSMFASSKVENFFLNNGKKGDKNPQSRFFKQNKELFSYNSFFSNSFTPLFTSQSDFSFLFSQDKMKTDFLSFGKRNQEDKNLFFLRKWAKTQKFSLLHSKQKPFFTPQTQTFLPIAKDPAISIHQGRRQGEDIRFADVKMTPLWKPKKTKSHASFMNNPSSDQGFRLSHQDFVFRKGDASAWQGQKAGSKLSQNLMNLDVLYFQKVFQNFKNQKFEKRHKNRPFFHEQKKEEKKRKHFPIFKEQTSKFLSFQHYRQSYKKFLNSFGSKIQTSNSFEKTKKKEFSFLCYDDTKRSFGSPQDSIKANGNVFLSQDFVHAAENKTEKNPLFYLSRPILFQFLQNENTFKNLTEKPSFSVFTEKLENSFSTQNDMVRFHSGSKNQKMEFGTTSQLSPKNFYEQSLNFSLFPKKQAKQKEVFFQFAKFNFFEKFQEKLFTKNYGTSVSLNAESFFSKLPKIENFQHSFVFETSEFQKPLCFQKTASLQTKNSKNSNSFLSSRFQNLQFKKKISHFQYKTQNTEIFSNFSGFSKKQKKFEKVFQAFFSPLNNTKKNFTFLLETKDKFVSHRSKKTKKDSFFLQSVASLMKRNPEISFFQFFSPTKNKTSKHSLLGQSSDGEKEHKTFLFYKDRKGVQNFQKASHFVKKTSRLSPQLILKRDGFLFLSPSQKKTSFNSTFNFLGESKKNTFESLQRLEKEKSFQKKRRLKKEKLETRRRKKRKRFFPRPVWLRMNLYKKFLKTRHSKKLFSSFVFPEKKVHLSFSGGNDVRFAGQSQKNFSFFSKTHMNDISYLSFSEVNFAKKKQKWFKKQEKKQFTTYFFKKFQDKTKSVKKSSDFEIYDVDLLFLKKQNSTFQSKTFQKNQQRQSLEKNTIFSPFSNFKNKNSFPYHFFSPTTWFDVVQQHKFKEIRHQDFQTSLGLSTSGKQTGNENVSKNIEHYKISNEIYQEFLRLSWKSSWFQNNLKPYTKKIQENFKRIQSIESQKNFSKFSDFFAKKNFVFFFHDFPVFCEQSQNDFLVRKSVLQKFSWYTSVHNSFSKFPTCSADGKKNTKFFEYNHILYSRISDVLKKFKFSENMTNESFFESFKANQRKNEKIFSGSKNSFFTKTALFFEKFQVPSQPEIPAFSVFSSLFQDSSLKPTGDLPTLRAQWAFQKTNFSHFQDRNAVQNLWAFQKRKATLTSFKGTKKIMNFLRKLNGFEKFKTPHQFFSFDESKKTFFLASKKAEFINKFATLDTMTLKKFQNVEKKASVFGIQSFKQNSKISSRYFQFHLSSLNQNEKKRISKSSFDFSPTLFKNKNRQNSAKSSLNFWWSQRPFQNFDFLGTSPFQTYQEFSKDENFFFEKNGFFFQNFSEKVATNKSSTIDFTQKDVSCVRPETFFFSNFSFYVFAAFFFHFAVFYSLFKVPEIRSVLKFTFLIFSKFWKTFFLVFFSLYNIFKRYTKNGLNLLKNSSFLQHSNEKNVFSPIGRTPKMQEIETQRKQSGFFSFEKSFISDKKTFWLQSREMNFPTYLFAHSMGNGFSLNKRKNHQITKFDTFLFEFIPRFSAFGFLQRNSFGNAKDKKKSLFLSLQKPVQVEAKLSGFFGKRGDIFLPFKKDKTSFVFGKQTNEVYIKGEKNFRESLLKTKSLKNFDSAFLLKISFNSFSVDHSQKFFRDSQFENQKTKFFFLFSNENKKREKFFTNLSKVDKVLTQFALSFLLFGQNILFVPYHLVKILSSFYTKIFEIVEGIFYAFYKFLEKPAEFMIEFIAFVFLIEWSSDILGFFPDSIESSMWKSSQKLLRPVRTGTFFFAFGVFFLGTTSKSFGKSSQFAFHASQNFSYFSPFQFLLSTGYFHFSNFAAFVLQKRLLNVFENFPSILIQPDIDILVRQRKGILFWDIWAEILLKAAEKYNVNLPSFVTLKEEQELFIEKLVRDSQFFETLYSPDKKEVLGNKKNLSVSFTENSGQTFSSFLQNFVIQYRPFTFFDFYFSQGENFLNSPVLQRAKNRQKLQQFLISNLFSPGVQPLQGVAQNFVQNFPAHQARGASETASSQLQKNGDEIFKKDRKNENISAFFPFLEKNLSLSHHGHNDFLHPFVNASETLKKVSAENGFNNFRHLKKGDRWECNQFATFQSQETDFFLDIYPPKSLKHVHFLKYYEPAHYTLGSLICQIYAGVFPKQISKNILVVGESGTAKTFFLRALAGETEMKIITENASRYAMVQRGVAVGMKYLRDVFDAIALQTPCFFVMEDLHIIGSKRPFLISENENGSRSSQKSSSSFGSEQQEVHETNQMIYQSSRHSISDFRRPYKGDFSMGIPTNYFLQTFYSPFFSSRKKSKNSSNTQVEFTGDHDSSFYPIKKGHVFQNSQFFGGNLNSSIWNSLSSPLPIDSLEFFLENSGIQEKEKSHFDSYLNKKNVKTIQSSLQFAKEQIFAPPATSPFTVLMMKEQKKLKPKKIVQETSWGGLSADQMLLYQKESSSIRAKIATLADKTMNLSRGKFDMITDFLVIIDSVRSNRGFVVFGTTHKPSSLDPALRRPGRFDETLSLSRNPTFLNRFEIFKMNLENSVFTLDFFDYSIFTDNFSEMDLFDLLSQTKLSLFHNYKYSFQKSFEFRSKRPTQIAGSENSFHGAKQKQLYSQTSITKAFHALLKSPIFEDFYSQKQFQNFSLAENFSRQTPGFYPDGSKGIFSSLDGSKNRTFSLRNPNFFYSHGAHPKYTVLPKGPSHMLSLAYSKLGVFLAEANLAHNPNAFIPLHLDIEKNSSKQSNFQQFYGNVFFDSKKQRNLQLQVFLSGKIAEFFINSKDSKQFLPFSQMDSHFSLMTENFFFEKPRSYFLTKFGSSTNNKISSFNSNFGAQKIMNSQPRFSSAIFSACGASEAAVSQLSTQVPGLSFGSQKDFSWTVFGNDESWRSGTPFLLSIIQKRFLFTKNLLLSKMLFFENMDQRRKPPSPPASSILMPSKKYENFKRTEVDFFQKAHFSIHEKIQMHQKQRFLKQLYNIPVETYFRSELRKNHKTLFSSSFQEFAYLDSFVQKSSSSHSYYRKYIQVQHRFSNINQWWNGMFPEHTRETTYLSDVDWRTMFVSSKGTLSSNKSGQKNLCATSSQKQDTQKQNTPTNQTFEFLMDFPDTEQYYNPRNRRWFFKSNVQGGFAENFSATSDFWAIFEKDLQYEIFSHFLMESFSQSLSYFDKKREMLDFCAFHLLQKGFLKEFDFLTTFSRF
jgi:SpoVK/Ycf46/Vps4 family AAA+-type ATPase